MMIGNIKYRVPIKDASFSELKNIPERISDASEGKLIKNIVFIYILTYVYVGCLFMVNPVALMRY